MDQLPRALLGTEQQHSYLQNWGEARAARSLHLMGFFWVSAEAPFLPGNGATAWWGLRSTARAPLHEMTNLGETFNEILDMYKGRDLKAVDTV